MSSVTITLDFKCGHHGQASVPQQAAAAIVLATRKKLCADCLAKKYPQPTGKERK